MDALDLDIARSLGAAGALKMAEITEREFTTHIGDDDFCRRYGNPVFIRQQDGDGLVCMAWEHYERLRELTAMLDDEDIKYWICEFEMSPERRWEFDRACAINEMTPDELFQTALAEALGKARADPEWAREEAAKPVEGIRMVRMYPVYKGETEAQAYKRKLAEENAAGGSGDSGGLPDDSAGTDESGSGREVGDTRGRAEGRSDGDQKTNTAGGDHETTDDGGDQPIENSSTGPEADSVRPAHEHGGDQATTGAGEGDE